MQILSDLFGTDPRSIAWWQMTLRAGIVASYTLGLVRFGGLRIFGRQTAFDIVLGVILGSTMSRAITGNAALVPTMVAGTVLVALHRLLALLSYHSPWLARLIKGQEVQLLDNGRLLHDAMRTTTMTARDLDEALRSQGGVTRPDSVRAAYLERSGEVSVIRAERS